jgi:putative transposase
MSKLSFDIGVQVSCRGKTYVITRVIDLDSVLGRDVASGTPERLSVRELQPVESEHAPKVPDVDLDAVPDADWQEAERRFDAIRPLLGPRRRTRAEVTEQAKAAGVHLTTVYDWIRRYESVGRISALLPTKPTGGRGKSRLDPKVEGLLERIIKDFYLKPQRPSIQKTIEEVEILCRQEGLSAPHPNTIRNRIAVVSDEEKLARRVGHREAAEKYDPVRGSFPGADWPLAVGQIDHTKLDIILVDDENRLPIGRPWLTLVIDVFSRMVLGFYVSLDPPGTMSVGLAIAHAVLPKEKWIAKLGIEAEWPCWGFMRILHADNAREFRGNTLKRACKEREIILQWRPVKKPHYGAHIERLLGTFAEEIHAIPGTTFSNIAERRGYDSEGKAALTLFEFEKWLAIFITSAYHKREHTGIGTSPIARYKAGILGTADQPGTGLPSREIDEERLRLDFMPAFERTIRREYGVVINHVEYYSDVLKAYIEARDPENPKLKRKFSFRQDPRDISKTYFYDPFQKTYLTVPYRDTSLPPISIWEFREAIRYAQEQGRKEIDQSAIFEALQQMRRLAEDSVRQTKKARRDAQRRKQHEAATRPISKAAPSLSSAAALESTREDDDPDITPFEEMIEVGDRWTR